MTICVADIEPSIALYKGVFLRPRRGLFPGDARLARRRAHPAD